MPDDVRETDEPSDDGFARELAGEMAANSPPKTREGWTPGVEMGAVDGQAVSEPIESDDPNLSLSEADLIRRWHLDPEAWEIVPGTLLVNRWMAMKARQFGNERVWLYQYKARLRRVLTDETLPLGLRRGADWKVTVKARGRRKPGDLPDPTWEAGIFYPDPQIGYWWDEAGVLHTIHDERCFDIRNQVLLDLRSEYGRIAKVVGAGDTGDFSHWSSFQTVPAYLERTLQPALDRITLEWAQLRAICPGDDELIWILDGNHDGQRLLKTLLAKGLQSLVGVRQGGVDIADHPVLSIQHLTRTDDFGVRYVEPFPSASVEFNESLGCAHGPAYSSAKLGTATKVLAQARRSMLHGHCFDEDTEILTPEGWVRHDALHEGSLVMSMNKDTGALEWNAVNAVFRYTHHKEMVSIRNRNVDLLVTGEHGLWGTTADTWGETTANEAFGKNFKIKLAGVHDQEELPVTDAMIRLLAWVFTDGSVEETAVRIAQSDQGDGRIGRLESTLTEAGVEYTKTLRYEAGTTGHGVHRNFDAYRYTLRGGQDAEWFRTVFKYMDRDKTPLSALYGMSARQMRVFLDAWLDGDGSRPVNPASRSAQTSSVRKDHMDLVQQLACRTGMRSSLYEYVQPNGRSLWRVTLNDRDVTKVSSDGWQRVPYEGVTWCVSVDNGTLLVRRNGYTAITLNTHREESIAVTLWTDRGPRTYYVGSPGTFSRTDLAVPSTRSKPTTRGVPAIGEGTEDWQQGFYVVLYDVESPHHFEIEHIRIWNAVAEEPSVAYWRGRRYLSTCDADGNQL